VAAPGTSIRRGESLAVNACLRLWLGFLRRALAGVAACFLLGAVAGCLTDGSIPVGGGGSTGSVRGVVVFAEDPDAPLAGARVSLRAPGGLPYRTTTDDEGRFGFENMPKGTLEATFEGPQRGARLPVRVFVETDFGSFSTIAVALAPAHLGIDDVAAVAVTPQDVKVRVGESVPFQVSIDGGVPVRKVPTWIVEGGIGSIDAHGRFQALRAGTGVVRAVAGNFQDSARVTVLAP